MKLHIAPSILSADFAHLAAEIRDVELGGADWLHVDVMDGHFVPNLTIGPLIVEAIRPHTELPLDVHLMIEQPERYIQAFANAGAHTITVHAEACVHLHRTIHFIKSLGVQAGVALNPATPLEQIDYVLPDLDLVLLMTVNPGFGGQQFISSMLPKISKLRHMLERNGYGHIGLEVDGGINPQTAPQVIAAGANVLVAGNAIFGGKNRAEAIAQLRSGAIDS